MTRNRARGFTIMELMMVLTISAILASFALPGLRDMVARTRLKTAASDLHTALTLARSEAIKRNGTVTISPLGGGTDWAVGWEVKSGTTVLTTQDAYTSVAFATTDASYATALATTSVSFTGTGRASPAATPTSANVAFILTAPGTPGSWARCVLIDPSGRPSVRSDVDGDASDGCN